MRALFACLAVLVLAGCSIFDKPDPSRLDGGRFPSDIGIDMGPDAGIDAYVDPHDGGPDVGDAFVCPHSSESNCGDGHDDDCDGLIDCADPDCIVNQSPACCTAGVPTVVEHFTKDATGWSTEANWVAPTSIEDAITSNMLLLMGASLTGMVNRTCLRVDLGTELHFTFQALPCTGAECDGRMEVVLGPSAMFTGMLTDDLAIRGVVTDPGNLRIDIVQGGTVRSSSTGAYGTGLTMVTVDLAPGLARGVPAIIATVSASLSGGAREVLASQIYVTDRDIFGTSSCHGLHLGVQGSGSHVALDDVGITQLDCSNPARFDTVHDDSDTIDAVTMSVADPTRTTGWGHGGIGDPALVQSVISSHPTFTLLFDGSPVDRASDVIGHLPLQIGGDDTSEHGSGSDLIFVDDCSRWQPRGGGIGCMPSTSMPIVDPPLVRRDPTLYPNDPTGPTSFITAWVGETSAGSDLALFTGLMGTSTPSHATGTQTTIDHETCTSFRNPLLLPWPGMPAHYLLFYVCDTFPPVVRAATFDPSGPTARAIDGLELGPTELGPLAAQGVVDIAGVVYEYAGATTYRLWLATRPTTTETAVLYVEGVVPMGEMLPVFTPFAGNPVLTEQSPVFGSCSFGCQLHGITATRIQNDWTHVRLLVERWVDSGSGLQYGLVPLQQTWPTDHHP